MLERHASTLNPGAINHLILRRPNDEVIIVQAGMIEAFVNDQWVRVGPGLVIFNAANALQSMRNVGDGPATYHVIMFRPAATPRQSAAINRRPPSRQLHFAAGCAKLRLCSLKPKTRSRRQTLTKGSL